MDLEQLLPLLRCPATGSTLARDGAALVSEGGDHRYSLQDGVPDLMRSPERMSIDAPWFEPWDELDAMTFERPEPLLADDLPYHLDGYLASVPGPRGLDRTILEIGCGERRCEPYFTSRGFRYIGSDVDHRGVGPHLKADAHNLPFRDGAVDMYMSLAVYEHLACPLVAAREAYRVIKPGGTMFGTAAFVYGFHDRASFNHMTHAGLLWMLRMAGFTHVRIWSDWDYADSIAEMGFGDRFGAPWRFATGKFLHAMEWTFTRTSKVARRLVSKGDLDLNARRVEKAGSLTYVAHKPATAAQVGAGPAARTG